MRGEQQKGESAQAFEAGSPPLARGTDLPSRFTRRRIGITPACAGNSCVPLAAAPGAGDHPRLRGEQLVWAYDGVACEGSPPLARGTVADSAAIPAAKGITPACAGNSCTCIASLCELWDHPRLRGEQYVNCELPECGKGSPPLARGTVCLFPQRLENLGITPACAGNSKKVKVRRRSRQDHPRLRGEQLPPLPPRGNGQGSPPLARGTAAPSSATPASSRITPACAGNSQRTPECGFHR